MRPAPGKGVCSDSNRSAQRLQMAARESLETMSGMIVKRLQPKFAVKLVANEMRYLNAMWWPALTGQDKLQFFDYQLSLFEVDELLEEQSPKIVRNENISTQIYVECDKMYRSKVCVQEFSYIVSGLDIQVKKSKYNSPTLLDLPWPLSHWFVSIAEKNSICLVVFHHLQQIFLLTEYQGQWLSGFDSWWVLKHSASPKPFCRGTEPVSALTHSLFVLLNSL